MKHVYFDGTKHPRNNCHFKFVIVLNGLHEIISCHRSTNVCFIICIALLLLCIANITDVIGGYELLILPLVIKYAVMGNIL